MGLAASQVRLLQLTSRQHKIEYQAQMIQAQKLQLANESDKVYNDYMAALDAKKIQYKYIQTDGSIIYKDATFNNMFSGYNEGIQELYALHRISDNKVILSGRISRAYRSNSSNRDDFIRVCCAGTDADQAKKDYYGNLWDLIQEYGYDSMDNTHADDYKWLTNVLANGDYYLSKWDPEADGPEYKNKGAWTDVSVSTDTLLQEVADEKELKKAEAVYEAENTRINRKDSKYDTMLSQTETERNAVKTEMESLKTVRNENIDRAFKLFS